MIKVNNKKVISNLSNKSFKANKTRNIIAIVAIALTSILFTALFTMGIGTIESIQQATMRQAGGDGHAMLKYITDEQFETSKTHLLIKEISYQRALADKVENPQFLKRPAELWYSDPVGLRLSFCEPTVGTIPQKENEVIVDTKTLELLGVPQEIGAPITLSLNIKGQSVAREFVLSGWWESDKGFNVGRIFTSKTYVEAHEGELQNTYKTDYYLSGCINAYIMFENSTGLQGKLDTIIKDSGFSSVKADDNYVASNINWSYLATNFSLDAPTIIGLGSGLLLIMLTGYLIIYNIFQISIIRDIRFYGLLKTIGTTGRQIRSIIKRQALILSAIGIPIGLLLGFFSGKALVPFLTKISAYSDSAVVVSPNPWIFVGAALFALATVLFSTWKPCKIAASVSPVEAVKYTEGSVARKGEIVKFKKRKTTRGTIPQMASANMNRDKKRTTLVVISLSLSLILLNTVLTLSGSLDMDKFVSKFTDMDFLIAHADYFQSDFTGIENQVTQTFIEAVQSHDGFEEGGRLYGGRFQSFFVTDKNNNQTYSRNDFNDIVAACYGLESLPFNRLALLDGALDEEKLLSGKYILEGVFLDDNSKPKWETAHYKVGDTVNLHNYKGLSEEITDREYTDLEFTVIGHVSIKNMTNCDRTGADYTFYLPAKAYKKFVSTPAVMSYVFNVKDGKEADLNDFLKTYTETVEPLMNYDSKATVLESFSGVQNMVLTVGIALSLIIGLIGVLNFINSILTSIVTRRKEFAMMQSIGMTRKQLSRMLCLEGFYYSLSAGITVAILGIVCSLAIVQPLCGQIWFMGYNFIMWPLMVSLPVLLLLGIVVPLIAFSTTDRQSIVERLRDVE